MVRDGRGGGQLRPILRGLARAGLTVVLVVSGQAEVGVGHCVGFHRLVNRQVWVLVVSGKCDGSFSGSGRCGLRYSTGKRNPTEDSPCHILCRGFENEEHGAGQKAGGVRVAGVWLRCTLQFSHGSKVKMAVAM